MISCSSTALDAGGCNNRALFPLAPLDSIAGGIVPATVLRPDSPGGARPKVVAEVELELPGLVEKPCTIYSAFDRKAVHWFQNDKAPTLTTWAGISWDKNSPEEWHWALQAQQPAPLGCAAIPNVGVQMHLPEGKDEEGKRGEKSPQGCWRGFPLGM